MARRIPKRGLGTGKFNHMQTKSLVQTVNLDRIESLELDKIDVNQINRFEGQLLEHIRSSHPEIINAIKETGDLDESTDAKLDQVVSDFVKTFA